MLVSWYFWEENPPPSWREGYPVFRLQLSLPLSCEVGNGEWSVQMPETLLLPIFCRSWIDASSFLFAYKTISRSCQWWFLKYFQPVSLRSRSLELFRLSFDFIFISFTDWSKLSIFPSWSPRPRMLYLSISTISIGPFDLSHLIHAPTCVWVLCGPTTQRTT